MARRGRLPSLLQPWGQSFGVPQVSGSSLDSVVSTPGTLQGRLPQGTVETLPTLVVGSKAGPLSEPL